PAKAAVFRGVSFRAAHTLTIIPGLISLDRVGPTRPLSNCGADGKHLRWDPKRNGAVMPQRILATRPATEADFDFAWKVYADIVGPQIEPRLNRAWEDAGERERFRTTWQVESAHVITLDDVAIGWAAARVSRERVDIDHFYLKEEHRAKGYGTIILKELMK